MRVDALTIGAVVMVERWYRSIDYYKVWEPAVIIDCIPDRNSMIKVAFVSDDTEKQVTVGKEFCEVDGKQTVKELDSGWFLWQLDEVAKKIKKLKVFEQKLKSFMRLSK